MKHKIRLLADKPFIYDTIRVFLSHGKLSGWYIRMYDNPGFFLRENMKPRHVSLVFKYS